MRLRATLAVFLVILATAVAAPAGVARPGEPRALALPGHRVEVRAGHTSQRLMPILAPARAGESFTSAGSLSLVATADIQVTYSGFSQAAQDAFEAAVNVWESMIVSDQVIRVNASWTPLGTGVLGSAGPTWIYLLDDDRWYPAALAEALCGCDRDDGPEIQANFNSSFPDWYLGTDGNAPGSKYDFFTVVMHELGHGLGFFGSFGVSGTQGMWGWATGGTTYPLRFDLSEWSAATGGSLLTNTGAFANPSAALKTQLTDGSVFFGGPNVVAEYGGRAPLYAPSTWNGGSSNSHFDEVAFPTGTQNALMTPFLSNGEVIHDPGPLTLALLRDIGWTTTDPGSTPGDTTPPEVAQPTAVIVAPEQLGTTAVLRVSWPPASDPSGISAYELQRRKGSNAWMALALAAPADTSAEVVVTPGKSYRFRVRAMDGAGNVGPWTTTAAATLTAIQEKATSITYAGSWKRRALNGASGGYVRYTGAAGRTATLAFTGTSAALVSTRAPARGLAEIWLDGTYVETIDLYAATAVKSAVVWATPPSLGAGAHTLQVRVTGTRNPLASKNRVDVDAFLVWP